MIYETHSLKKTSSNRRFRLLAQAIILAILLTFLPLGAVVTLHLPQYLSQSTSKVSLNLGPTLIKATQGLTITKSASPATVDLNGEIEYTLIVTNNTGGVLTTPVWVSDTVPLYTQCDADQMGASSPSWGFNCQNNEALWTLPTGVFSDGATVIFTFTATVTDIVPFGTEIVNDSYLVKELPVGALSTGTVVVSTPVNSPRWSIDKQITDPIGPIVAPGAEIEYSIAYSNSGAYPISGTYIITDVVPAYTILLTPSLAHTNYSGITPGNIITWTLNDPLGIGAGNTVSYRVQVTSPLTSGLIIVNDGYGLVGGNVIEPASGDAVSITVQSAVDLALSKRLQNPNLGPGSNGTYLIDYSNNGNAIASDVWITDTLPTSVSFVSSLPSPAYSNSVSGTYAWYIPVLAPQDPQTIFLEVMVDPAVPDGTLITNTVTITSPTEGASQITDVYTSWVYLRPDIKLRMSATEQPFFSPTEAITYSVVYSNLGTIPADTTVITLSLPKLNVDNISANGPTLVSSNGSQLVFEQLNMTPGQTASINIDASLVSAPWSFLGENFVAQAVALAEPLETNPDNNADSAIREGRPGPMATWVMRPTGDVPLNKFFNFYIEDMRDFYGNVIYNGTPVTFNLGPRGTIDPPATSAILGQATAVITSSVPGTSALTIVVGGAVTTTANLNFLGPDLGISKVGSPNPVPPGDELVYTIAVSNSAGSNAGDLTNVVVSDTLLSPNLIFNSATPSPTLIAGNLLRFELGTIEGGEVEIITIRTTVDPATPDFSTVTNTVLAVSNEITTTPAVTDVTAVIIPVLEKHVTPETVPAGEALTYTIVYRNKSDSAVSNVRLTDTMSSRIGGIQSIEAGGASVLTGSLPELVFNFPSVAASSSVTITIVALAAETPWPAFPVDITNNVSAVTDQNPTAESVSVTSQGTPDEPAQIAFNLPTQIAVGSSAPVDATISDQYGNPVLNGTGATFSVIPFGTVNPSGDTSNNGVVNSTLSANQAGTVNVTVNSGTANHTEQTRFVAASFDISKRATPNPVAVGNPLVFTIRLTNTAAIEANNTTLLDILGDDLSFNSASMPYSVNGNEYTFNLGTLQPSTSRLIVITTTVSANATPGDTVTNTAQVSALGVITPATAIATAQVFAPDLNKIVSPANVRAGETISYTIIYNNFSGASYNNIVITDVMPARISSINFGASDLDGATLVDGTLPTLVFSRATLAAGQATTITLVGQVQTASWPSNWVNLLNVVTATNASTSTSHSWQIVSQGGPNVPATLSLTAVPTRTLINGTLNLSATLTDQYDNPVLNGTAVGFSASAPGQVNPANSNTSNGVANATITANQSATVIITATSGSATDSTAVEFVSSANPSLAVIKQAQPSPVNANENLVYTIQVGNTGDIALTNLSITDTLDAARLDLGFLETKPAVAGVSGSTYQFNLGFLNIGTVKTVVITAPVQVAAAGQTISNTAWASATGLPFAQPSNQTATPVNSLGEVSDSFNKYASPAVVRAGETITFSIVYTNENAFPISNLRITDTLPAQVASIVYTDTDGANMISGGTLTQLVFNRPSLGAGETTTITLVVQMQQAPWQTTLSNLNNIAQATNAQTTTILSALAPFQAGPNLAANFAIQYAPNPGIIDNPVTVSATLTDQYDNLVLDGTQASFSIAAPGSVTGPVMVATLNGMASTTVSADMAGTVPLTVSADSAFGTANIIFVASGSEVYLPLVMK